MRIDDQLARSIAHNAKLAPYRQIKTMGTRKFVDWLGKRDIHLTSWETLHGMWSTGMLNAVGARDVGILDRTNPIAEAAQPGRLERVALERGVGYYADRGLDLDTQGDLTATLKYSYRLDDAVHWHPLQLWVFSRIQRILSTQPDWNIRLNDAERMIDFHKLNKDIDIGQVREFVTSEEYASFQKLLALLLEIEPWEHGSLYSSLRFEGLEYNLDSYLEWRNSLNAKGALQRSGLTLEEAVKWHERLSVDAWSADPVLSFRKLLRHADRQRREGLKGMALLAHTLYDHAEILRRYLEADWGQKLQEEPDVSAVKKGSGLNLERYGAERLTNYNRSVMKRIAREHGVDASYAAYLFVEGKTEVAYVERWVKRFGVTLDNQGVLIRNLRGVQNINLVVDEIRMLRDEEVFAVVCLDEDKRDDDDEKRPAHVERLEDLTRQGQLPVDYKIWKPNFVEANFSLSELVEMANERLAASCPSETVTLEQLEQAMLQEDSDKPARTAEAALFGILPNERAKLLKKGKPLGKALADWSWDHPAPDGVGEDGERPIDKIIQMTLGARKSSYALTVEIAEEKRKARRHE